MDRLLSPQTQVCLSSEHRLLMLPDRGVLFVVHRCRHATLTTKVPLSLCGPGQRSHSSQPGDIKEGSAYQSPCRPSVISPYQHLQACFMREAPAERPPGGSAWNMIHQHSQTSLIISPRVVRHKNKIPKTAVKCSFVFCLCLNMM